MRFEIARLGTQALQPRPGMQAGADRVLDHGAASPEERVKSEELFARLVYRETGKLRSYTDANGAGTVYKPSDEEIAERDDVLIHRGELRVAVERHLLDALSLIALGIAAVGFGYVTGRMERTRAHRS